MNKMNFKGKNAQAGFTLIELIVVIVILGVLAATALPKFVDLGADARVAKMQAAAGAMKSASATFHGQWLVAGSPSGDLTQEGVPVSQSFGYPDAAGIVVSAGLSAEDYPVVTPAVGATLGVMSDANHATCTVTYTPATSLTAPPSVAISTSGC